MAAPLLIRVASPVACIAAQDPPFLIIYGTADEVVPYPRAQRLHDALRAKNLRAEPVTPFGIGHCRFGETADATRTASVAEWDRTTAFIDRTIRDEPR